MDIQKQKVEDGHAPLSTCHAGKQCKQQLCSYKCVFVYQLVFSQPSQGCVRGQELLQNVSVQGLTALSLKCSIVCSRGEHYFLWFAAGWIAFMAIIVGTRAFVWFSPEQYLAVGIAIFVPCWVRFFGSARAAFPERLQLVHFMSCLNFIAVDSHHLAIGC
jgi:hypothetical protein